MRLVSRPMLSIAALAVLPVTHALAADYDPPIFVEEAPEYVPVEIGSGWYLRGDVGYSIDSNFKSYEIGILPGVLFREDNTSIFGGAGIGYQFSDMFRADANINFISREKFGVDFAAPGNPLLFGGAEVENKLWTAMLNGYVDLGTVAGFTPYVGAGIGIAYSRSRAEAFVSNNGAVTTAIGKQSDYSFAYSLGAGVAYAMTPNLKLDVGYQYLNAPNAEFVSITEPFLLGKGLEYHQVKVGLRYSLW